MPPHDANRNKITGGQTINDEIGGDWERHLGDEFRANSANAAPNLSARATLSTNKFAGKAEIGAEANAFEFKDPNSDASIKTFGAEIGADAEAGLGGVGVGARAKIRLVDASAAGFGVKLGAGVSTGLTVGPGGVETKLAEIGRAHV